MRPLMTADYVTCLLLFDTELYSLCVLTLKDCALRCGIEVDRHYKGRIVIDN
jgi:hypothetical protein